MVLTVILSKWVDDTVYLPFIWISGFLRGEQHLF